MLPCAGSSQDIEFITFIGGEGSFHLYLIHCKVLLNTTLAQGSWQFRSPSQTRSRRSSATSISNRHLPGIRRAEYTDPFNSMRYNRRPGDPLGQNKSTCEITLQSNQTLTRCCLRFCCITTNPGTIPSNSSRHFNSDIRPLSRTALLFRLSSARLPRDVPYFLRDGTMKKTSGSGRL